MAPKSALVLLALALAGAASAYNGIAMGIYPRQTDLSDMDPECISSALSVAASVPSPAPELMDVIVDNAMTADPNDCNWTADIPESLSTDYSSWTSELRVWHNENSAALSSLQSACPGMAGSGVCTDLYAGGGVDASPTDKEGSPTRNSDSWPDNTADSASDDEDEEDAAPGLNAAFAAWAAIISGLAGAIALL